MATKLSSSLMSVNWFKLEYYSEIKFDEELDDNSN
ncbi:hypothetical protein VCSRO132_3453 [Vibrio cholerae]|nr:hypothetical protein VCSRO152_3447 [Vibrio cholerae]GHZ51606.1 hypothetical protein VCSRO125_3220 [Vibrio cholerae]GIA62562.1 hypothetical protein VCSRO132_3453 [Vibrio cholerae]GIA96866.1 hypothetical protein VCSRO183_3500 [Vibrio cholerae]